jgi:hypothetical protein
MIKKFTSNPWLLFSPLLIIYSIIIKIKRWPGLVADEYRYLEFARNLLHGFFSPPAPNINLWNGPGYPISILPFVALKVPVADIVFINGLYHYFSVVFLYQALSLLTNRKVATVSAVLLAVYFNTLLYLPVLYTEVFTGFLVSAIVYSITLCYVKRNWRYGMVAGMAVGYLMLTKIIFGYVILVCLAICLLLILFKKNKVYCLKAIYVMLVAFAVSSPYLVYTWRITGRLFYWGNSGGMSLYWMSSPYEHEYGDWKLSDLSNYQYPILFKSDEANVMLKNNHSKEMQFILSHTGVEQDDLFKKIALNNIKTHPLKFIKNYRDNFSRLLFNFPYSYSYHDDRYVQNIITGSLILWASVAGIILTCINWREIVFPIKFGLLITTVYLLLSGALSAYARQFDIIVPVLIFWIAYLAGSIPMPDLKFQRKKILDNRLKNAIRR